MNLEDIQIMMNSDPYALAGKYVFIIGIVTLYALCIFRQKMNAKDSALAMIGVKKVLNRDWLFTLCHIGLIVTVLVLMTIALQRNLVIGT